MNRRAQKSIGFRSDRAAARLRVLTKYGHGQVSVIEEALDNMPDPPLPDDDLVAARMRIDEIVARIAASGHTIRSMAEFDADEYDERGNLR